MNSLQRGENEDEYLDGYVDAAPGGGEDPLEDARRLAVGVAALREPDAARVHQGGQRADLGGERNDRQEKVEKSCLDMV